MMWQKRAILLSLLLATAPFPAHAVCEYRGQLYARTSDAQEFQDADWVVRARVVAEHSFAPSACSDCPGRLYRLELIRAFKGEPPAIFPYYTPQNSGGFYLEQGSTAIGSEWLLFLNRGIGGTQQPPAARDATSVNYSCGRSRKWSEVRTDDREQLLRFSGRG